jgi:hypothetical protein
VERSLGESKGVDESVVSGYKPKLLELISPYEPKTFTIQCDSRLREKSVPVAKCQKKDLQCYCVGIWWEKWKSLS